MDTVIAKRYVTISDLASGGFGTVHVGVDTKTHQKVIIKMANPSEEIASKLLVAEYNMYCRIYERKSCVPQIYWFGKAKVKDVVTNVMVMELLGVSLGQLFDGCFRKFPIKTSLMIGFQLLDRIRHIHSKGMVHRDIKLDNIVTGILKNRKLLYLIDFGLGTDGPTTEAPTPCLSGKIIGTSRYCSRNAHLYAAISYRDDLESYMYVLLYLINGSLPWDFVEIVDEADRLNKIYELKATMPIDKICEYSEIRDMYDHINTLKYNQKGDCEYLMTKLKGLYNKLKCGELDWEFCWLQTPI